MESNHIYGFRATVYRVLIASPSDVQAKRDIIRSVLTRWNDVNAEKERKILLPIDWETHSYPMSGNSPQKILNEQTLEKADLLIGVFWYRLGIPTDDYPSGSVEEYEKHVQTGKPAMLYFSMSPIPQNADMKQFSNLNEFKKSVQSRVLYNEYQDEKDFENLLFNHISQIVNDKLPSLLPMENPLTDKEFESRFEKELEKHTMSSEDVDRILRETGFPTRQNK